MEEVINEKSQTRVKDITFTRLGSKTIWLVHTGY